MRNINSLALFSNIEVNPRPDEKNEGGIIVEIKLKELEQKTAEVSSEWSIVPGRGGRPTLVCICLIIYLYFMCQTSYIWGFDGNVLLILFCVRLYLTLRNK